MDNFLLGYDSGVLLELEKMYDFKVEDFDDYLFLLEKAFKTAIEKGAVAIKNWTAYTRGLNFKNVTKRDAINTFQPITHQGWARKSISPIDIQNC